MALNIPNVSWSTEQDPNAFFQMFTPEGNNAVAKMLNDLVERATRERWMRDEIITWLKNAMAINAQTHGEIHDTEPEWAIVDVMNEWLESRGFTQITRDDLF